MKRKIIIGLLLIVVVLLAVMLIFGREVKSYTANRQYHVGMAIDSINEVKVYFNGNVSNVSGRNLAPDGYNLGLKYQCVEFVKRYYYKYYQHKMPDSYGHAKSFFDRNTADGKWNKRRNLMQYANPSRSKPKTGDLIVFDGTGRNPYGHVAIISKVSDHSIEIIQQNPGLFALSRISISLRQTPNDKWQIINKRILGWLRKR